MTKRQKVHTGSGQSKHAHEGHAQELILSIISHLLKVMKSAKILPQTGSQKFKLKSYGRHLGLYNNTIQGYVSYLSCHRKRKDSGNFQFSTRLKIYKYYFKNYLQEG